MNASLIGEQLAKNIGAYIRYAIPIIFIILILASALIIGYIIRAIFIKIHQRRQLFVSFRLVLREGADYDTQAIYERLHPVLQQLRLVDRLTKPIHRIKLEIVSNKTEGTYYRIVIPESLSAFVTSSMYSSAKDISLEQEGLPRHISVPRRSIVNRPHSLPLASRTDSSLPTLFSAMTDPGDHEQFVISLWLQSFEGLERRRIVAKASVSKPRDRHHLAKLSLPLFDVSVRSSISGTDRFTTMSRQQRIQHALLAYMTDPLSLDTRYSRSGSNHGRFILTPKELSDLISLNISNENVIQDLVPKLPLPLTERHTKGVTIGINEWHGKQIPVRISEEDRRRHVYMVGGTGNGKTTVIKSMLIDDINAGRGVALIDPHGDLAADILSYVPQHRIDDVIYLNPDDLAYPIGINVLELNKDLKGDDLVREKDLIVEALVSVFRKIFANDGSGGHRVEYVLRNTAHTAMTVEGATLFTMYKILQNTKYRNSVIKTLEDEYLVDFWKNEFNKAGDFQKIKMAAGITSKLGRFLFSAPVSRVFGQERSTVDFNKILNEQKILICNFSKGLLGDDTSELFGIITLAELQLAALRRARISEEERKPFYLYVDEFQNFATPSFVELLSEARKYALSVTMAQQSSSQQPESNMVNTILANVGVVIAFRTANLADERILAGVFKQFVARFSLSQLPKYAFYTRIFSTKPRQPFSAMTILPSTEFRYAARVVQASRYQYATLYESNPSEADKLLIDDSHKNSQPASVPAIE